MYGAAAAALRRMALGARHDEGDNSSLLFFRRIRPPAVLLVCTVKNDIGTR